MPEEAYRLSITTRRITIEASSRSGFFYAAQSLLQLVDTALKDPRRLRQGRSQGIQDVRLPCLEIEDRPRFVWRGLLLDEARHFFGPAAVRRLLDEMACLKMNRLHWHLTDKTGH